MRIVIVIIQGCTCTGIRDLIVKRCRGVRGRWGNREFCPMIPRSWYNDNEEGEKLRVGRFARANGRVRSNCQQRRKERSSSGFRDSVYGRDGREMLGVLREARVSHERESCICCESSLDWTTRKQVGPRTGKNKSSSYETRQDLNKTRLAPPERCDRTSSRSVGDVDNNRIRTVRQSPRGERARKSSC